MLKTLTNLLTQPELASDADEHNTARSRRRRSIRRQIGERAVLLEKHDALGAEIKRLEAAAADAADEHGHTCEPLQRELSELSDRAIERVRNREPSNTEEDDRRVELSRQVEAANSTLRETADRYERLKSPLVMERLKLSQQFAVMPTEQNLLHPDVARSEWVSRQFGLSEFSRMLNQFRQDVLRKHEVAGTNDMVEALGRGKLRTTKWDALLSVISEHDRSAQRELGDLLQQMINE